MSKRFAERPRGRTVGGGLAVIIAAFAVLALSAGGAQAAGKAPVSKASGAASYTGTHTTITRISASTTVPNGLLPDLFAVSCAQTTDLPLYADCGASGDPAVTGTSAEAPNFPNGNRPALNSPFNGDTSSSGQGSPRVPDTGRHGSGDLLSNFNGIYDSLGHDVLGYHVTPPDQGLCVGPAGALEGAGVPLGVSGDTSVVVEAVNDVWAVYSKSGNLLYGPEWLGNLFSDIYETGDVSCNYDPATQTFFFTEIGAVYISGIPQYYGTGIAVLNANGYAAYGVDTAEGGYCFPDFPQHGFDNNAFYITINEFCGPNEDYAGANLYALSKSELASLSPTVDGVYFAGLEMDGIPVVTLRPAIGNGTDTEYLLDSVSYGADGNSTNGDSLGFWQVTGDANIASDPGSVMLSGRSIPTEPYAYPVNATSTGDGSCTDYGGTFCITSETYLDPVDSRLLQVQFVKGHGPERLYTSLDTALTVGGDSTPVDGAAWFDINPKTGKVNHQGYVGVAGTNLLNPSMVRSGSGTLMMGFSMTSPTLDPSTGYVLSKNEGNAFGPVQTTGEGSGPHMSFTPDCPPCGFRHRWGDYSAVALDPTDGSVWMADEYIPANDLGGPNRGGSDQVDNWGTRVWGLSG